MATDVNPIIVRPEAIERARNIERLAHDQRLCIRNFVCPVCSHDLVHEEGDNNHVVCTSDYCKKKFAFQSS